MVSTVDRRQKPINYLIRKSKAFFADWTHSSCVTLNLIFIKCDHFCWGLFQQFKIRLLIVRNHLFASCRTIIIHIHFSSKFFEISLFSLKQKTIKFFLWHIISDHQFADYDLHNFLYRTLQSNWIFLVSWKRNLATVQSNQFRWIAFNSMKILDKQKPNF